MSEDVDLRLRKQDLDDLHNTRKIVGSVAGGRTGNDGHFGLGLAVGFMKAIDEADLACLLVGNVGTGKTRRLEALQTITRKHFLCLDFRTLASLAEPIRDAEQGIQEDVADGEHVGEQPSSVRGSRDIFSNKRLTWISRDFSRLSYEVKVNTLKLICALATEHGIVGDTRSYRINVENSFISWFGACAFHVFTGMWYAPEWRDNFQDRLIRYYCLPTGLRRVNINPLYSCWTVPTINVQDVETPESEWFFDESVKIFRMNFSKTRSYEFAMRWLQGNAAVNNRQMVTEADYKFLELNRLNLALEKLTGYRAYLSAPLEINVDAMMLFGDALANGGVVKEDIVWDSSCPEDNWSGLVDNSFLLRWDGDGKTILPNEDLVKQKILPQIEFEDGCVTGKFKIHKTLADYMMPANHIQGRVRPRHVR